MAAWQRQGRRAAWLPISIRITSRIKLLADLVEDFEGSTSASRTFNSSTGRPYTRRNDIIECDFDSIESKFVSIMCACML